MLLTTIILIILSLVIFIIAVYCAGNEILKSTTHCDITVEYGDTDEENQIWKIHVYENGGYSHTVKFGYFTKEQIDKINKAKEDLNKND